MRADDQTTEAASDPARQLREAADRLRPLARRVLLRIAPTYVHRRTRADEGAVALGRLQGDFAHTRKRHDERLERLEDLVRELVLSGESLRRELADRERGEKP